MNGRQRLLSVTTAPEITVLVRMRSSRRLLADGAQRPLSKVLLTWRLSDGIRCTPSDRLPIALTGTHDSKRSSKRPAVAPQSGLILNGPCVPENPKRGR